MNNITPLEIADRPTDPYRIVGILEEVRRAWDKEAHLSLGEFLAQIAGKEYTEEYLIKMKDDELIAAIQNFS